MQPNFLLIQFRTDLSAAHEVDCICRYGKLDNSQLRVKNIFQDQIGHPAEELADIAGVILGGSGEFSITAPEQLGPALDQIWPILDYLIGHDIPTLGACFGHQLLGHHLGGQVANDHRFAETGSVTIHLSDHGAADPLFAGLPKKFTAQVGHKDTVTHLPDDCILLAHSDTCPTHAFRYKNHIYGVQFHAELDREDLLYRLKLYPSYLHGRSLDDLRSEFHTSPEAPKVLKNFLRLAGRAPRVLSQVT